MLELANVSQRYGQEPWVLQSVSFQLGAGERLAVVGPSGVGKSSLLRLIAGLESPVSGSIRINGQVMEGVPPYQRGVALMTQQAVLFPHWTVRQNLALGLTGRDEPRQAAEARAEAMASKLGIRDLLDRKPVGLSGGQQKRVALGRALIGECPLLLLDEPFSSLDSYLRLGLASELSSLLDQSQASAILVTHDVAEALSFGSRLMVLLNGQMAQSGPTREVYRRPATLAVARFLGDPPCSVLPVRLDPLGERQRLTFDGEPNTDAPPDGDERTQAFTGLKPGAWWVGVRPEHVGLFRDRPRSTAPNTLHARVTVSKVMLRGPATLVELKLGSSLLRAWTPPDARWTPGDQAFVAFDLSRLLWFDQETSQLAHGSASN